MPVFTKHLRRLLKQPWPPGKNARGFYTDKLGSMMQLRDGAFSSPVLYLEIVHRGARICLN